LKISR